MGRRAGLKKNNCILQTTLHFAENKNIVMTVDVKLYHSLSVEKVLNVDVDK